MRFVSNRQCVSGGYNTNCYHCIVNKLLVINNYTVASSTIQQCHHTFIVQTSLYQFIPVSTSLYQVVPVSTSLYLFVSAVVALNEDSCFKLPLLLPLLPLLQLLFVQELLLVEVFTVVALDQLGRCVQLPLFIVCIEQEMTSQVPYIMTEPEVM